MNNDIKKCKLGVDKRKRITYISTMITRGTANETKGKTMNKYAIKTNGRKVATITAEDAQAAARAYSEKKGLDSDWGFVRGVKMVDADTSGEKWAIIKTDGGDITAEII